MGQSGGCGAGAELRPARANKTAEIEIDAAAQDQTDAFFLGRRRTDIPPVSSVRIGASASG
jgi:hypothetical protein